MTTNEDLDCLEQTDNIGDAIDVLAAADPTTAFVEQIVEECILMTIIDALERF